MNPPSARACDEILFEDFGFLGRMRLPAVCAAAKSKEISGPGTAPRDAARRQARREAPAVQPRSAQSVTWATGRRPHQFCLAARTTTGGDPTWEGN